MDNLQGLMEASKILDAKAAELCREPMPVYVIVKHARDHVNRLIEAELGRGK